MKKVNAIELGTVVISFLFIIWLSLFHISDKITLGLSVKAWRFIWAFCENGLSLFLCVLLIYYSFGVFRKLITFVFVPYFVVKLGYHISCYAGFAYPTPGQWEYYWTIILLFSVVSGISYFLYSILKGHA